ncbi:probable transmembrane ascorbate ferrireductase 4 [Tanacetum coccineum]
MTRIHVLPWHVFLGLYTYGLAVVTAETGLLKKLTFLQTNGVVLKRCSESMIVMGLGLGLATLCGLVTLTTVSPKQYQINTYVNEVSHMDEAEKPSRHRYPTTSLSFQNSLPLPHLVLKDGMLMRIWQLVLIVSAVTADTRTVGEALASSKPW